MDFWILYVSSILISITLFTPFVFLADYIDTVGGTGSARLAGVDRHEFDRRPARLRCGRRPHRHHRAVPTVVPRALLSVLLWIVADTSYSLLILFAVVLGVAYGGFIALSPAVVAMQFGVVGMGGVLGALYTARRRGWPRWATDHRAIIDASAPRGSDRRS